MTHSLTAGKEQHNDIREVSTFINTFVTERHTVYEKDSVEKQI